MAGTAPTSVEEVTGKKIKVFSSVTSAVTVLQDGTAADGDATAKYDNAFRDGVDFSSEDIGVRKLTISLVSLTSTPEGKEFVFEIQDFTHINSLGLAPNDRVQLSLDMPEALAVGGSWPSWHSGALAADTQAIVFQGFIDELRRVEDGSGGKVFQVVCVDAVSFADRIILQQSRAEDLFIPYLVFNVDDPADPDRIYGIRIYDPTGATPADKYRQGNSKDPANEKMTVADILTYLGAAYQSDFYSRGLLDSPSGDIFDATEIAAFTGTPEKVVFENEGFGQAVRKILRANLPDHELTVDPRSRKWRITPAHKDIMTTGVATINGVGVPDTQVFNVDDASIFATSGDGSRVRVQSRDNYFSSAVEGVFSIATNTITLDNPLPFTVQLGDLVFPMFEDSGVAPRVSIELGDDAESADLLVDLKGVHTAVEIVGRKQERERFKITKNGPGATVPGIVGRGLGWGGGWDPGYNDDTDYAVHKNRRIDRGPMPDLDGIEIDEITTLSGPVTAIYFSEEQSSFENDHFIDGSGGSEWDGCACVFLTYEQADAEAANHVGIVDSFERIGWMDSPTNTIRRFRITLDRDILATLPNLESTVADGTGDKIMLSASEVHAPRNPNKRWAVGKVWRIESTGAADDARLIDDKGCHGYTEFPSAYDPNVTVPVSAIPIEQTTEAPRTFDELVDYWNLNPTSSNPITGGVPRAWFLRPPEPPPMVDPCDLIPPTPPAPEPIEIEMYRLKQEARSVRVPATGFTGLAYAYYGHSEVLRVLTDNFEDESQNSQFEAIAEAILRRVSAPHYSGSVPLNRIMPWIRMIDLGVRVTFGSGPTGFAAGVVTEQSRFWGLVRSMEVDFVNGGVSLSFESRGVSDVFNQDFLERVYVKETAEIAALKDRARQLEEEARCREANPPPAPPRIIQGCEVNVGGQSGGRGGGKIPSKNLFTGGGETALGVGGQGSASAGSVSGSHAFNAPYIVERNLIDGQVWALRNPSGAMVGGAAGASKQWIPDAAAAPLVKSVPAYHSEILNGILVGMMDLHLEIPVEGQTVQLASGSTSTVLQLEYAIPNDARFDDGWIEFKPAGDWVARDRYEIDTHTATTVTLKSAMAEALPPVGALAYLYPNNLDPLLASDYPSGGAQFKDASNQLTVVEPDGSVSQATVVGGFVDKDASQPSKQLPEVGFGFLTGEHTFRGVWNFGAKTDGDLLQIENDRKRFWQGVPPNSAMWLSGSQQSVNSQQTKYADDGSTKTLGRMTAIVPEWADGHTQLDITIRYIMRSAQDADWVMRVRTRGSYAGNTSGATDPSWNSSHDETISLPTGLSDDDRIEYSFSITGLTLTAGEIFDIDIQRRGADVADTYTGRINLSNTLISSS